MQTVAVTTASNVHDLAVAKARMRISQEMGGS